MAQDSDDLGKKIINDIKITHNMNKSSYILTILFFTLFISSCEKNDPIDELGRVGLKTPTAYWEIPSTVVKAGNNVAFTGQYYSNDKQQIDHTEVWYNIVEAVDMQVTYASTAINFSKKINSSSQVRMSQKISTYPHLESLWNAEKKTYVLQDSFAVSNTLRPVEWKEVKSFDAQKFKSFFPDTTSTVFKRDLYTQLTKNISEYGRILSVLNVYTTDQFRTFLDSVYNPNSGKKDAVIKSQYVDVLKHKFDSIPFQDFIYDNSTQLYKLEYTKSYKLSAVYKVFEKSGAVGVSDSKEVEIN